MPGQAKKIFISYRREDASDVAARIRDWLVQTRRIARDDIFMDVTAILPGADFMNVITDTIRQCRAMIVVISPSWIKQINSPDPSYVRAEAEIALELDIPVIPVLVGGATLPADDQLPEKLRVLKRRNVQTLRHETFDYDMGRVGRAVLPKTRLDTRWVGAIIAVLLVALSVGILSQTPQGNPLWSAFHTPTATTALSATQPPGGSSPQPTALQSQQVLSENLQMLPTNPIVAENLPVVLDTVTIDFADQKMLWKFTITNNQGYGLSDLSFDTLQLVDPNGRTYTASGQAQNTWNLSNGGSIDVTPTFNFVPDRGVPYTLNLAISGTQYPTEVLTLLPK